MKMFGFPQVFNVHCFEHSWNWTEISDLSAQAARKLAITEVDLERAEARLEAAES